MREINQSEFFELITDHSGRILIDFFATWCGPCKMFLPILEKTTADRTDVSVCKLDVENANEACVKYNVQSVPTLILFDDGVEIARHVGTMSRPELEIFLET